MRSVDLSCDLGEAANAEEDRLEAELWPLLTSANVACGGHIGDDASMRRAVERALRYGVRLGAHPSYPDREGFGRRSVSLSPEALRESLSAQMDSLAGHAAAAGLTLSHIKPHGALYNDAHGNRGLAEVVVETARGIGSGLAVVCGAHSVVRAVAREAGQPVVLEAFADRRYRSDGSLVPRNQPDALLDPEASAEQAVLLFTRGSVISSEGEAVRLEFDTLCIHGDMAGAVERLMRIRDRLASAGFAACV